MKCLTMGLIIKEQNIGEKDRLVFALTKDLGVVKAFVHGANNIKNQKCAATSLLSYSRLTLYKGRDTYTIGDAISEHIFSKLRNDVVKMCLAQYFCELAITICPREQQAEKFLKLILNSLYLISEDKRSANLVKACVEMRMTSFAGYMPDLRMCGICGEYLSDEMVFFPKKGAIFCEKCYNGSGQPKIFLNSSVLTALRHTIYADDDKLFSFALPESDLETLNVASENYIKYIFEKDFSTLTFYKALI